MRSPPIRPVSLVALFFLLGASDPDRNQIAPSPHSASLATDSVPIGYYTFDDGVGGPDPMGWIPLDLSVQEETFFHVDDFAGLGGGDKGGLVPLRGARSMWCGVRPGVGTTCSYATLPGYGNNWDQYLTSVPFSIIGNVEVTFLGRFDSEPGYDFTKLEYLTKSDRWEEFGSFFGNGFGPPRDSLVIGSIPGDSLPGTAKIRFHFFSDGAWSDEDGLFPTDGGVIIDSVLVTDAAGTIDFQDFEGEAVGATQTNDGKWIADPGSGFGNFAALMDGSAVLQEDSLVTNTTYLWGFFDGSTQPWECDPPDTGLVVVPEVNYLFQRIENVAASPVLDISSLLVGGLLPDTLSIRVGYDVYKDFDTPSYPFTNGLRNYLTIRSMANGCWSQWMTAFTEGGGTGQWFHFDYEVTNRILPGATLIQIGVGTRDSYGVTCHTQAPLIDNVEVYARNVVVTDAGRSPEPQAYSLHQNLPNPFNPTTTIAFDVPAPGAVVSLRVYDVAGRLVRTLHTGFAETGPHAVEWDGRNTGGASVASGVYFYRLDAPGFTQTRKMVLLK